MPSVRCWFGCYSAILVPCTTRLLNVTSEWWLLNVLAWIVANIQEHLMIALLTSDAFKILFLSSWQKNVCCEATGNNKKMLGKVEGVSLSCFCLAKTLYCTCSFCVSLKYFRVFLFFNLVKQWNLEQWNWGTCISLPPPKFQRADEAFYYYRFIMLGGHQPWKSDEYVYCQW